ncbi:MAG: YcnI family protein [Casimicrobium sp.]
MKNLILVALVNASIVISFAQAHVVLEQKTAPATSYYRAIFRVGHGCDGSPTTAITVRIPQGVKNAKPAPKPGWSIERKVEKLATPYISHGKTIAEGVTEITWRGGPLADEHYDEFLMQIQLPDAEGPLWFKVLQQCEKGQTDWAEIPAQGTTTRSLKAPAALLEVVAPVNAPSKSAEPHKH